MFRPLRPFMNRSLLCTLAVIVVGCAEPTLRNLDDLSRQGPQYLDPETLEPFSGPALRTSDFDPTKIVLRVNLSDGRLDGDFEDLDPEGAEEGLGIYQTGTYRDGQREGRYENWYPSGVLRGQGTYRNDKQDGPYESHYENGELRNKTTYKDGELHGRVEWYYENGELRRMGKVNMGLRCGEWIWEGGFETNPPCPPSSQNGN